MNEENAELALQALTDLMNGIEAGIEQARRTIKTAKKLDEPKTKVNLDAMKWQTATGPHGQYEKTVELENPEYQKLYAELTQHDGRMTVDGWFLWTMNQGGGIGRKRKSF